MEWLPIFERRGMSRELDSGPHEPSTTQRLRFTFSESLKLVGNETVVKWTE
jgi:hypothetical protein